VNLQKSVGVVVIGRNEGDRLRRCLGSISSDKNMVVYVDSGSTDNSVNVACEYGASIVSLDMATPFSAARARNEGYDELKQMVLNLEFVQFIDGDCELMPSWLGEAANELIKNTDIAIVAGRLNEKNPSASIYNRLADLEWNFHGAGEVDAVGGIFMVRSTAFDQVGGFDSSVTAGEEPELCQRLRNKEWKIIRLDSNMAWHDLAMTRFKQWWKRQVRGGYGGLDVATRFGLSSFKRNSYRARFWTLWLIVIVAIVAANLGYDLSIGVQLACIIIAFLWPLQLFRITLNTLKRGWSFFLSLQYAWFTMLSFWPQMVGQIHYLADMKQSGNVRLNEYKMDSNPSAIKKMFDD